MSDEIVSKERLRLEDEKGSRIESAAQFGQRRKDKSTKTMVEQKK
jgi:hypothetical protein